MHAHFNRFELENYARGAADAFIRDGVDLNDTITKLAQENSFTPDHVDRVVQNANIFVNAALVNKARDGGEDPRISFPLAKSAEVMDRVNGDQHRLAELRKEAQVVDLFTVPTPAVDHQQILNGTVGGVAPDPYENHARSVDHVKLASDFVADIESSESEAKNVNSATLGFVCQTLESLEHRALTDHTMTKNAMFEAEDDLKREINDQLLYGSSPATLRDVVKHAGLDENTAKYVNNLITKTASDLRVREGKSAFGPDAVVNTSHSLITKSAAMKEKVQDAARTRRGLDKFATAHKSAHGQYVRAVREGR